MNKIDFYTKLYGRLYNYGLPYWVMTPVRRMVRKMAYRSLPAYLMKRSDKAEGSLNVAHGLIVSLTSFPARIRDVWQVVECMKRQTLLPEHIFLYLADSQFPNGDGIPETLRGMEDDLFQIKMVGQDIKSHKKYQYVCAEYPEKLVVLIDDDIYYSTDMIERMMAERTRSGNVVSMYCSHIIYKSDGSLAPYQSWPEEYGNSLDRDLFFGSGGGVLFQPSELYKDLTNIELAMRLTPTADDIWLNAMVRLSGKRVSKLKSNLILPIKIADDKHLCSVNVSGGANDRQLMAINSHYQSFINGKVF